MSRDGDDREDFASRWSRRKRAARTAPVEPERAQTPEAGVDETRSDEQILEELGLPDPDALKPGDDVSAFMASAVPARLRNRALRRLWASNPLLANLDGLIDYGEDYTDAAMVPEVLNTAYRVGRGWVEDDAAEDADAENEDHEDGSAEAAGGGDGTGTAPAADGPPAPEAAPERLAPRAREGGGEEGGGEAVEHGTDEPLAQDTWAQDAGAQDAGAQTASATEANPAVGDPPGRPQAPAPYTLRRRMRFRFPDT